MSYRARVIEATKALQRRIGVRDDGDFGLNSIAAINALLDQFGHGKAPTDTQPAMPIMSVERLIAAGLDPTQAKRWQPHLAAYLPRFGITTPERIAGWIGQIMVESAGFKLLEENLYYTTPSRLISMFSRINAGNVHRYLRNPQALANLVYADRLGNGPESSGDGWRFRGRGLKQLTGRANYTAAARALNRPYVENPDLVAQEPDAVLTAAWFWQANRCDAQADRKDWDAVTRIVNGPAMVQAAERRAASNKALRAFR